MAESCFFYGELKCGGNSHSAYVDARPCDTRDGRIAQWLELRTATGDPTPNLWEQKLPLLTQEGSFEDNDVSGRLVDRALGSVKRMRLLRAEQDDWRSELVEREKVRITSRTCG